MDRATVRARQGRALHEYLKDCVLPFSAHYQRVFKDAGLSADDFHSIEDLEKMPFTSKADLLPTKEEPRKVLDFVLKPEPEVLARRPKVILRALLRGRARVRDELDREWRPIFMTSTTGRSSEPVPFLYSQHDITNLGIGSGRVADIGLVTREEKMINMLPFAPHLAFWYMHQASIRNNIFCLSTGGGKVMGTDGNLRAITKLQPSVIVAMPTFIYHVLHIAIEKELRIEGLRLLCLGGEKVADGMRRKLRDMCATLGSKGVQVVATYGFTECKQAFTECPFELGTDNPGYHTYPDMGIIEVVDPKTGKQMPDGEGGEIVWTALNHRGTAVLRYRTGDKIEKGLVYETCPCCGRTLPRLVGNISRVSDVRSMQFGKVKGTIVDFNELELVLDDVPGVASWQIELRKANDDPMDLDEIVLHLATESGSSEETVEAAVKEKLQAGFEIRPNRVEFHTSAKLRELQEVGVALKERKVIDRRKDAGKKDAKEDDKQDKKKESE
jgi:phenylacetate-coenzyme A ligase PaaK-like adenylate-forming protein